MLTNFFYKTFAFINEKILRNTKQSTINVAGFFPILTSNLKHEVRSMWGSKLKLQYPNDVMQFPLPNRWCHPTLSRSKQQTYMVLKQLGINFKDSGIKRWQTIEDGQDKSLTSINTMKFINTLHLGQIDNISLIEQKFGALTQVVYTPDRELLFADSMVNGEVSYMLRKYGHQYYELPQSQEIDQNYRTAFEKALKEETWNDNAQKFGLSRDEIIKRVSERDGVYTMLYEHMEKESNGNVMTTKPELYMGNKPVDEIHYMHVPYPIFLNVRTTHNTKGFICIGVGMRVDQKVKIFSPFFAKQGERVWRLAQSHISQIAVVDFAVRVHLGLYHFTTNQYHVPVYNTLDKLKSDRLKKCYTNFIDHSYAMFSQGLEGVNVAATSTLVHQIPKYSLINKALNISQDHAINIIASTTNNLKIYDFNPRGLTKNNGISQTQINNLFPKMSFDFQLYDILSEYVEGTYKAFRADAIEQALFNEINAQTKNMGVGKGSTPRPALRSKEDVLTTLKNLCFTWVGFHSHTFSVISLATYFLFRPAVLKEQIPKEEQWQNIQVAKELPDAKIFMEQGKLNQGTTQRDPDNFLTDQIRRQVQYTAYKAQNETDPELRESFKQFQKVAQRTYEKLRLYQDRILDQNKERHNKSFTFEWMIPSKIQTSLNI